MAALLEGREAPPGLLLDRQGQPTTHPTDVFAQQGTPPEWVLQGSLLPIGGYKGYALAVAMMVLSSLLVGGRPAWERAGTSTPRDGQPDNPPPPLHNAGGGGSSKPSTLPAFPGTLFICLDIASFTPLQLFRTEVDAFLARIIASAQAGNDEIAYPGLRSGRLQAARRERNVVPLTAQARNSLNDLAEELGMNERITDPVTPK
jgi:LDH2 family malate/lactate/ureidoglycolate dehydrogenase